MLIRRLHFEDAPAARRSDTSTAELLTRRCTEQGVLGCILRLPKGQHYMRFEVDGADAVDDTLDVVLLNGQQLNVRFIQLDLLIAVLAELAC